MNKGKEMTRYRVSHHPSVPGPAFRVEVDSIKKGVQIMETLAVYDLFLEGNGYLPNDEANANYLEVYEEGDGWVDFGATSHCMIPGTSAMEENPALWLDVMAFYDHPDKDKGAEVTFLYHLTEGIEPEDFRRVLGLWEKQEPIFRNLTIHEHPVAEYLESKEVDDRTWEITFVFDKKCFRPYGWKFVITFEGIEDKDGGKRLNRIAEITMEKP